MTARKWLTGTTLFGLTILATATGSRHAEADAPKVSAATKKPAFRRAAFKTSTKPALSVTPDVQAKVRAAIDKATAELAKHKSAAKFLKAGSGLGPDAESLYRNAAADALSSQHSKYGIVGAAPQLSALPATYSIESGEVLSGSVAAPCAGELQVAFTLKNRGSKLPTGKVARLFVTVTRAESPSFVVSEAWVNLPPLDSGAMTTVQVPSLRHRAPTTGGSCPGGDIHITPTFIEARSAADYRLRVQLTDTGADATLLTGPFLAPGAGGSGGNGGGDDCGALFRRCGSGVCALFCPPCPPSFTETSDGACAMNGSDWPGSIY